MCSLGDPVQITRNHLRLSFVCPSKYPFASLLLLSMVYIWVQQNPTGLEGHFMLFTLYYSPEVMVKLTTRASGLLKSACD